MQSQIEMIKKLKDIELNIFQYFVNICKKLHLSYYMMDGSLLGTIRHNGFIPWDDDIDVGMMREDYEMFIAKAQEYLPEYMFLQTYKSDPRVLFNFAKIRDSRTTFIETSQRSQKINHGIYIDIFPIDGFPETIRSQRYFKRNNRILSLRIRRECTLPKDLRSNKYSEKMKTILGNILKIKYPTVMSAIEAREKLYKSYQGSTFVCNFCGAYGYKAVIPREKFGEGKTAMFEGIPVTIPEDYDYYLKRIYGDYMTWPPKDKRIPHHYAEIIDIEKPYTYYIK